ncbi:MAG: hypothetical protein K0U41_01715, partial [Gammaproteobacteria bacterium]|nr:hypothetical protein [Gammaproteobacteria bacterium]
SYAHRIRASYTASPLNGVGGFIGSADQATSIENTYAVSSVIVVPSLSASSSQFGGFAGEFKGSSFEASSYWDSSVTDFLAYRSIVAGNGIARGQGTLELIRTAEFSGTIYHAWGQFWCNPATSDIVQQATKPAGYIALWDLGSTSDYPVLNCTPLNLAEQQTFFADIQINDLDRDGVFNAEDVDEDGDGLIEISNATTLDSVRENVRGNSLAGITSGCGNSIDIFDCNGYELTADIDLASFSSWEPIAGCDGRNANGDCIIPSSFISNFDGNGHTISNLRLNTPTLLAKQLGLFASVAYADIRNVHIANPQMDVSGSTYNEVGVLAGDVLSSTISNISISGDTLTSIGDHRTLTSHVGGMIGYCDEAVIKTASVRLASMTVHANDVGGLVGRCKNSQISGAFTQIGSITTFLKDQTDHAYVGGLVGALEGTRSRVDASYSHTQVIEIPAPQNGGKAGGLIGQISDSTAIVNHSYAVAKKIIVGRQGSAVEAGRSLSAASGLVASTVAVSDSFWDSSILAYSVNPSTLLNQPSSVGVAKNSVELRSPVDFVGSLYDNWKDLWCNPLTSDVQTSVVAPGNDWVRLWDLGSSSDYPVMNCANAKKSAQRAALNNIRIGRSLFDLPVNSSTIIDTDSDGVADLEDVDDDGDGLIEIATATEFNDMREDSYGRSFGGNAQGCGDDANDFVCKGYELVSDIDLASFSSWDPIAGCTARGVNGCSNFIAFGGDVQGNGHTISNLRIDSSTSHYHIGLFAATTGSNIENLQIESPQVSISGNPYQAVGVLVGVATGGAIRGISINGGSFMVEGAHIDINSYAGGMIGSCNDLDLEKSSVRLASMTAYANDVGGLAGRCKNSKIKGAFTQIGAIRAFVNNLQGHAYVGGLIGVLEGATAAVEGSYSHTYLIEAPAPALGAKVGGLIGYVEAGTPLIRNSYAVGKKIVIGGGGNFVEAGRSTSVVGGLVAASTTALGTYWDDGVSAYYISPSNPLTLLSGAGSPRRSAQLRSPVNFPNSIYEYWTNLWCDVGTSDISSFRFDPGAGWSQIWNLGTATDYPTLNCLSTNNAEQKAALAHILAGRSPFAFSSADIIDDGGPAGRAVNDVVDHDGDGFNGIDDVDDDGDGLIEITTLAEMLRVSNDLKGTSFDGSTLGCGNSVRTERCNGYELIADIDLSSQTQWSSIGNCYLSNCDDAQSFSGVFEGNNHIISNLTMTETTGSPALGLFGSTVNSTIRNVHIRNLNIDLVFSRFQYAGALVGRSKLSSITNSSATGNIINDAYDSRVRPTAVGGLVGSCVNTTIISSASQMGRIMTNGEGIGGLVGGCESGQIFNSYSQVGLIESLPANGRSSYVGGLIGDVGSATELRGVYSHINTMNVTDAVRMNLGGIAGILRGTASRFSGYAILEKIDIIGNTALDSKFGGIAGILKGDSGSRVKDFYWNSRGIRFANGVGDGIILSNNGGRLTSDYELQTSNSFMGSLYQSWEQLLCNPQTSDLRTNINPPSGYINSWNLGATTEYPAINCSPFTIAEQREVARVLFPHTAP